MAFIIDIAITANRPDGMSMVGIAKEVAAITGSKLDLPIIKSKIELRVTKIKKTKI